MKEEITSGTLWEMTKSSRVITLIGAAGKTTCLTRLAEEVSLQSPETILTTTTKVYPVVNMTKWRNPQEPPPKSLGNPCFWYARVDDIEGKWLGPDRERVEDAIEQSKNSFLERVWLVEGDGARGRMLKCWAEHEPQIPLNSACTVLILADGLWGQILTPEQVHRVELCPELIGVQWNMARFWHYLLQSPVFDRRYSHMSWVVFCNQFAAQRSANHTVREQCSLKNLAEFWYELTNGAAGLSTPLHLRLAQGNAKEGRIEWYDLW